MLACGCDDDGPWILFRYKDRVARKQHVCSECKATIAPGEEYSIEEFLQDRTFFSDKRCLRCAGLWDALASLGFCRFSSGVLKDSYWEYLTDYVATQYDEERDEYLTPTGLTVDEAMKRAFK